MGTELCYLSPSPPGGCLCIDCYTQRRSLVSFTRRSLTSVLFHRGRKRAFVRSPSSLSVCLAAGLEGEMKSRASPPAPPPFLSARKAARQWRWRRLTTGAAQTSRRLTGRRGLGNEVCPFITLCLRFTFESPKKKKNNNNFTTRDSCKYIEAWYYGHMGLRCRAHKLHMLTVL